MIYTALLTIHIIAGTCSLIGAGVAIFTKVFDGNHNWHLYGGRTFFFGMVIVFLTIVPMTLIKPNLFLLLIGIFSFYLAFTGWRMARNRIGTARPVDFAGMLLMALTATGMIIWGGKLLWSGDGNGVTLAAFGGIGGALAMREIHTYTKGPLRGKKRIGGHVSSMIAAVTAFLVTNVQTDPVWIAWLAPTIVTSLHLKNRIS
jgi:hypothetical protein